MRATFVLLVLLCACTGAPRSAAPTTGPSRCRYHARIDADMRAAVAVRCDAPIRALVLTEEAAAPHVEATGWREGRMPIPSGQRRARYQVDLRALARAAGDPDVAYEHEGGLIAAASSWLLRPVPARGNTRITLRVDTPESVGFASGLRRDGSGRRWLEAREIAHATYTVLGRFHHERLTLPGPMSEGEAIVDLVTLPGPLAVGAAKRRAWVASAARAVASFWRGFPVRRALVVIVPTWDASHVAHGKVTAAGGPGVMILLGSEAEESALYDDWILVHELFHLGFPSFVGEGKWLDEGLATYYEPIIRARAGWQDAEAVWQELVRDMPRGLVAVQRTGVERTRDHHGIYWGGAILALFADVRTRAESGGARGLEDGLLAVLARGGNASRVWRLDRAIEVIDAELGAPVMRRLAEDHAEHGSDVELAALFRNLGVERVDEEVTLRDDADLAWVRDAIVHPPRTRTANR